MGVVANYDITAIMVTATKTNQPGSPDPSRTTTTTVAGTSGLVVGQQDEIHQPAGVQYDDELAGVGLGA